MGTGSAPPPDAPNLYDASRSGVQGSYDGGGGFQGMSAPYQHTLPASNPWGVLNLILRGLTLVFALISLSLIASTKSGDLKAINFSRTFRFLVSIDAIVMTYSLAQLVVGLVESGGSLALSSAYFVSLINFGADQLLAYMVFAACAASAEVTSALRSGDLQFVTSGGCDGAGSVCSKLEGGVALGFLSFAGLAVSSLLSGFTFAERARKA